MLFLYSLLYSFVLLILLPFEYLKRKKELRSRWLRERFGFLDVKTRTRDSRPLWIHAVSVGEVISAVPFIKELKGRYPSIPVVLSTVTDTGQRVALERVGDIADIVYLPFDLRSVFRRALKKVRPAFFIAMETELWPNIFLASRAGGIPVLVFNGRLSDSSFSGYRKIRFFIRRVVRSVELFCMQEQVYRERIIALGADEDRVRVTGNFKFDTRPREEMPGWTALLEGPVILAGSTHEGEEELLMSSYERLREDFPGLVLVVAPRHPERFGKVEEMVRSRGIPYFRRSSFAHGSAVMAHGSEKNSVSAVPPSAGYRLSGCVIILDTVGELASAYGAADIAVIGGSFIEKGGHNPLEPAFWGKPVVCGPHMENFPFMQDFYVGSGAIKTDREGIYDVLRELLRSQDKRKSMGEKARALYKEKAGAVRSAVEILEAYLKPHLPQSEKEPLP